MFITCLSVIVEIFIILLSSAVEIRMTVKPETYYNLLTEQCYCSVSCMIGVKETKQTYTDLDVMNLTKPKLNVKVSVSLMIAQTGTCCWLVGGGGSWVLGGGALNFSLFSVRGCPLCVSPDRGGGLNL